MTDLRETGLIEGLPPAVADEPWVRIMDKVYRARHEREMEAAERIHIYTQIGSQPEEILDTLAEQLKVDWYRDSYSLETKRRVIQTALEVRRFCGTEWAVEKAISAIYPDSEIMEWYDYGGTPGYWRLNVNITGTPTTSYTVEEMENLLKYAKRFTSHLEHINYMVRYGISVGVKVECMKYEAPECGIPYCGTYWKAAQLGYSTGGRLDMMAQPEAFLAYPKLTGTVPEIATKGWSEGRELQTSTVMDGYPIFPAEAGNGMTGDLPIISTKGYTADMPIYAESSVEAFAGSPGEAGNSTTGTKPSAAAVGNSTAAETTGQVKIEAFKIAPNICGKTRL